ncbi:hypothetical protein [Roseateles sp. BYS96W]|uniref:Uncharacterized protein n=1 Tax=Pelomonas nitida TaxID=3299027 RepID=A0ABW7GC60_9BURK
MNLPPASLPGLRPLAGKAVSPMPSLGASGVGSGVAISRPNVAIERQAHTMRAIAAP